MIEILPNWHPVFVHFPIAFATTTVAMLAAGILFSTRPWAGQCLVFGCWIFFAAVVSAWVAAIFGWFAFDSVAHDEAGHFGDDDPSQLGADTHRPIWEQRQCSAR